MFLERFFNYITYEKRFSKHTILAYENDIAQYRQFLEMQEVDVLSANHHHIRNWIVFLMELGTEANTVNRKVSSLRTLYKFLLKENLLDKNPTYHIITPKIPKKLPVFFEEAKLSQLLDSDVFEKNFSGLRDRLVIEFMFGTGVRLSELISLKISDTDLNNQKIKILGKRNRERIVPLTKTLVLLITEYLCLKKDEFIDNNSDNLIVTDKGLVAYPKLIYRIVKNYLSIISTQNKKSPHILRHTFATALLNAGADINSIKELLGHANLASTQIYTHNSIERIKSIYKQAHPKA